MSAAPILTVLKNGEAVKTFPIEGEAVLGRDQNCVIRLEDRAISRQHVIFKTTPQGIQIEKRSEFAPLFINGKDVLQALLKEGDIITIGPYQLTLTQSTDDSNIKTKRPAPSPAQMETMDTVNFSVNDTAPKHEDAQPVLSSPLENELALPALQNSSDVPENTSQSPAQDGNLNANPNLEIPESAADSHAIESNGQLPSPDNHALPPELPPTEEPAREPLSIEGIEPAAEDAATKVSPANKIALKLVFKPGDANVQEYALEKDQVYIGRGKSCDVVIKDKKASRKNTLIQKAGLHFIIKDLDSSNGTYINGVRIAEQEISGDAEIRIGDTVFHFYAASTEYAEKEKDFIQIPAPEAIPESPSRAASDFQLPNTPALHSVDAPQIAAATTNPSMRVPLGTNPANHAANTPNIIGIAGGSGGRRTLMDRYRALSPVGKIAVLLLLALFIYWFLEDETPTIKRGKKSGKPSASASHSPAMDILSVDDLPLNKRDWVKTQIQKSKDAISVGDFDKAIAEIELVTREFPNFTVANEILRVAQSRKQRLQGELEEKKRKEAEERRKQKVAQLAEEIRVRMQNKDFKTAEVLFAEVLELDPENPEVSRWKKDIQDYQEEAARKQQEEEIKAEIKKKAWEAYGEALAHKKKKQYQSALRLLRNVVQMEVADDKLNKLTKKLIASCLSAIRAVRDPLLQQAKEAEERGEIGAAFKFYEQALAVDPYHPAAPKAMSRLRELLHNKSKMLYTEGVLAEGYSDFNTARSRFEEILNVAPKDDVYFERAKRKLATIFKKEEPPHD